MVDQRGADIDYYTSELLQHLGNNGLRGEISALQVCIQKVVEISLVHFEKRLGFKYARVVY